jgi:signal transduction histidine kinase/ligand-binding sensor domain-containing protein
MKYIHLFFMLVICIVSSCNTRQENQVSKTAAIVKQDTIAPIQITVIADLQDSLQPKTIALDTMPKPNSVLAGKGDEKPLAVLQNEKGEPILDPSGNPFILGDGGKSNFTAYTTDNGLALDAISCSVMDATGNLWFGTFGGGVSKYNGKSFTSFTTAQGLANNGVWSITEDKSGNLWFGTYGSGVSKYDGKSFTSFTTAQGLASNTVLNITEDKSGNLWFGTHGGGVSKYDGKSFTSFTMAQGLASNTVLNITEDKSGNLWFGTHGSGVSKYDGKSFTSFTTAQGLANNRVLSITEDKSGNLWFGTNGGGVSKYDGKSFTNFTTAQGLANNQVWSITEDKSGNLWFSTEGGGVSKYDGNCEAITNTDKKDKKEVSKSLPAGQTSFTSFTTAQGLANNIVRSITEDKSGNLWFGTYGGGVSKYDGKSFTNFTTAQGLAKNSVYSITEDKSGNLWFGTDGSGVSKYDGKSFTNFTTAQGLADNTVYSITEDKSGNLWFGTFGGGVSKYDGKSFTNFTTAQGLANNQVWSITEDKSGNLWFGTFGGGVSKYDGKSFTNFTTAQGLANNTVRIITEDNSGNLWFGTEGGGVSKYDRKSFTNFTTAQGLANNTVWSITEDRSGNLWFGTDGGLSLLNKDGWEKLEEKPVLSGAEGTDKVKGKANIASTIFKSYKIADGLPDNIVTQVIQMPNGKIAVGTNLGITMFNLSEDFTKLKDLEVFNSNTGYPVKDVNTGQSCMLLDSKGIIWAGNGSEKTALVRFDYTALHKSIEPPALVIQTIKVKDENICWYNLSEKINLKSWKLEEQDSTTTQGNIIEEYSLFKRELTVAERDSMLKRFGNIQFDGITKFYPLPQNLVLPYEHNQIAFEFAAIETDRPFLVKYQYMLEGYDKDWSPITNKSNANFGNINEGTYTFKLKAQGANGVWSKPITYTFKVLPPWYRTWWAYLGYTLLFLLALRIFSKYRERHLRAEKEKLEQTVEERTKELKSSQAQLIQSEKMASLGELTAGIAHEIQNPLNFVNNFSELSVDLAQELKDEVEKLEIPEKDKAYVSDIIGDLSQNQEKINHHGKRASDIVKGMLEHSRKSTGEKELTDINALCDEYLRLAFHGYKAKDKSFNVEFETHFDPNLPKIEIIPQDMGRVILNLINNAFWAVNERSKKGEAGYEPTISITSKRVDSPLGSGLPASQQAGAQRGKGDNIQISISDNGSGIPDSIKDKIFQPFFTTKPTGQGTGLGLSLAYDIVKAHGGELMVETKEGLGSEFIIQLPYQTNQNDGSTI